MITKLTDESIVRRLPKRPKDAHKGTFGKVLVIAGSENYPGAAYLSCASALRVGAGLVTLATVPSVRLIVAKKFPNVTFLSLEKVYEKLSYYDSLLFGPGLGTNDQTAKFIGNLIDKKLPPLVIDADGLNILSKIDNWVEKIKTQTILTPHPGEMAKLTGLPIKKIQADRLGVAKIYAKKWNKVIVLKGANTVIASPLGQLALSPFANPLLATAGTGDVLAGAVASFLAQGLTTFDAATVSVFVHGLAAQMIKNKFGDTGMVASDLLDILPLAIKKVKQS